MTPIPNDISDPRQRVKLQLDADGRAGLYDLLAQARGASVGDRFVVKDLFAAGRQMFVFGALDRATGQEVILKQPAFDYRDPLQYSRRKAEGMRSALLREHQVQSACKTGHMSCPVALIEGPCIVPEARGSLVLGQNEVFSVQEQLFASPVAQVALNEWAEIFDEAREAAAARLAWSFVSFWEGLRDEGWLYIDVNALNLLVERGSGGLRVVDAADAVPAAQEVVLPGLSPAFSTPRLWERFSAREPVQAGLSMVLPLLAKVLHFALTRRDPWNAALPDLDDPTLSLYSPACREVLGAMLILDAEPQKEKEARAAIEAWADQ